MRRARFIFHISGNAFGFLYFGKIYKFAKSTRQMTIESALAVKIPVPNVIPFPSDPDFGKGDFFTGELGGKSKIDLLFETYVSERKKIPTKQKQKPFYLSPSECSKFPSSHNGQFAAMLETTRGFKKFEGLSEEILDKFLKYVGERTSKS